MNCSTHNIIELREKFPETKMIRFISASGQPIANTITGYFEELERLGDATVSPVRRQLRALDDLNDVYAAANIYLDKIEFFALDTTLTGSAHQDSATLTAIYNSRTTNDAYAQSAYKNAVLPVIWQPNWFRPRVLINGGNLIGGSDNPSNESIVASNSIGLSVPVCIELQKELSEVQSFSMDAACAQYITSTNKYQNYPIMAIATFWVGHELNVQ